MEFKTIELNENDVRAFRKCDDGFCVNWRKRMDNGEETLKLTLLRKPPELKRRSAKDELWDDPNLIEPLRYSIDLDIPRDKTKSDDERTVFHSMLCEGAFGMLRRAVKAGDKLTLLSRDDTPRSASATVKIISLLAHVQRKNKSIAIDLPIAQNIFEII